MSFAPAMRGDRWTSLERRLIARVDQGTEDDLRTAAATAAQEAKDLSFYDWVLRRSFIADREPVNFDLWRYLRAMYESVPTDLTGYEETTMKSSQGGATVRAIMIEVWAGLRYAPVQLGHFLPTQEGTYDMSDNRFLPLVQSDRAVHALMGRQDATTRRPGMKASTIDEGAMSVRRYGGATLFFLYTGGKISTESKPLDILIFDEVQEMALGEMQKANQRIKASDLKAKFRLSTANYEGADIHWYYLRSDQREFHTKCACPDGIVLSAAEFWDPSKGPTCLDWGSGATPGVPREPFYVCPKCNTMLGHGGRDLRVQDGAYIAHAPQNAPHVGWQFGQMLSPKISAREMLKEWEERADTQVLYNRALGRPFTDPNVVPITDAVLQVAEDQGKARGITWGKPRREELDGVFMGVDHMAQLNVVVIKGIVADTGKIRLLWLGWIRRDDPFVETAELFRAFRVRCAALEELPNSNDAFKFAKTFDGKVFVSTRYQELAAEPVIWDDRAREKISIRQTSEEARLRWTVGIDQHRMMGWSLARFTNGETEMPDSRALVVRMRVEDGQPERDVMLCREVYWAHLKAIALKTAMPANHEDELRQPRRFVEKIGSKDPHFAFANLLCDVAIIRVYGTERFLPTVAEVPMANKAGDAKPSGYGEQLRGVMPARAPLLITERGDTGDAEITCGTCIHGESKGEGNVLRCTARAFNTTKAMAACAQYIPRVDDEDLGD